MRRFGRTESISNDGKMQIHRDPNRLDPQGSRRGPQSRRRLPQARRLPVDFLSTGRAKYCGMSLLNSRASMSSKPSFSLQSDFSANGSCGLCLPTEFQKIIACGLYDKTSNDVVMVNSLFGKLLSLASE